MMDYMINNKQIHYITLFILCILAFFVYNDTVYVNLAEARNLVTAREMLEKGNWLFPTMNGEPRLAKPPLPTWITAVFAHYFGLENISMLRFPAGVMASLLVFFMYAFSYKYTKKKIMAFISSLVLLSSFYIVYVGRTATWDIYCHSFMLGAIYLLYQAWETKKSSWIKFTGASILLGLSFLSKGPVAFYALFLPFLISYIIVNGSKSMLNKWPQLLLTLGLFALIAFWWPVYIYLMHANEAKAIVNIESNSWLNRHTHHFWYYWYFPIESGVWTLFIFTALIFPYAKANFKMFKTYRFAFLWTIISVVLLSIMPEKKDTYLLPVLIPTALLATQFLYHLYSIFKLNRAKKIDNILYYINSIVVAVITFAIPFTLYFFLYKSSHKSLSLLITLSIIYFSLFAYMLKTIHSKDIIGLVFSMVIAMAIAEAGIMPLAANLINQNPNFKDIGAVKSITQINKLDYFHPYNEDFRTELVWQVGKEVGEWNFNTDTGIPKQGIAVFSNNKLSETLPANLLDKYEIQLIDYFNQSHNKKPKKFFKYLSIVKNKNSETR